MLKSKINHNYDQLLSDLEVYLTYLRQQPFGDDQHATRQMLEQGAIEFFYYLAGQNRAKASGDVINLKLSLPAPL